MWVSPDVWGQLGSMFTASGNPSFPQPEPDQPAVAIRWACAWWWISHFASGTMITGPSRLAEWYEDVDGLMQVGEPDVLGQLVGYAGFRCVPECQP